MEPQEFTAPWDVPEVEAEEVSLRLLDIEVTGLCCGPEAASWVSRFLGEECRVVQHSQGDTTQRRTRAKYVKELISDPHDCDCFDGICAGLPSDLSSDHCPDVCGCHSLHGDNLGLPPGPEVTAAQTHLARGRSEDLQTQHCGEWGQPPALGGGLVGG